LKRLSSTGAQTTTPPLGPTLDFLRLLWVLDHALQRRSKRMAKELGLTGPQRLVLRIVGRFPGIPAGELASLLSLHPSTLTGILQRLERGGWLARRTDPRDGRRTLLGLSARGRTLDGDDPHSIEAALGRVAAELGPEAMGTAGTVLSALSRALDGDTSKPEPRPGRAHGM
jgi:MarR family transcriptional regulator, organic hydroperoxide resistance regulator